MTTYASVQQELTYLSLRIACPIRLRAVLRIPRSVKFYKIGLSVTAWSSNRVGYKNKARFGSWYRQHATKHFPDLVDLFDAHEVDRELRCYDSNRFYTIAANYSQMEVRMAAMMHPRRFVCTDSVLGEAVWTQVPL